MNLAINEQKCKRRAINKFANNFFIGPLCHLPLFLRRMAPDRWLPATDFLDAHLGHHSPGWEGRSAGGTFNWAVWQKIMQMEE